MNKTQLLLFGFAFLTLSCMATGDEIPDIDKNQAEMAQEESITEREPVKAKKNIVKSKWQRVKKSRRFKILTLAGIILVGFVIWRGRKVDPYSHYKGPGKGAKKPVTPAARRPPARHAPPMPYAVPGRADLDELNAQDAALAAQAKAVRERLDGCAEVFRAQADGNTGPLQKYAHDINASGDAARPVASDSESVTVADHAGSLAAGRGEEDIFQGVVRGLRGVEDQVHAQTRRVDADRANATRLGSGYYAAEGALAAENMCRRFARERAAEVARPAQDLVERVRRFVAPGPAVPPAEAPKTAAETLADRIVAGARAKQVFYDGVAWRRAAKAYNALPWYQRIFTARP